jgi:di/tripeptidase
MSHSEAVCIDGLGPVGGNLHCEDEYIEIESLVTRTQMVFELLKKIDTEVL